MNEDIGALPVQLLPVGSSFRVNMLLYNCKFKVQTQHKISVAPATNPTRDPHSRYRQVPPINKASIPPNPGVSVKTSKAPNVIIS